MTLTHDVARFIVETRVQDVPADVIALGKKSILDGIGLGFAGSVAESGHLVLKHLDSLHLGSGPATVIGGNRKVAPRFAAFANGVAIHADDYDDTQLAVAKDRVYGLLTHPTAPALPAAIAIGEEKNASGKDVMLAYHLGVEVECKISEAINPRHYQTGFHSTATCGTFAAAAAASKLMGLDAEAMARALSVAGSQSAGLRENFGTMTKPFHAGRSSESGVVAAEFAALGWTATDKILEAPRGFFRAAGGGYDENAIAGKLGNPWTFASPGISIKPHPCGSLTHPGMTAMLELIKQNKIKAADVKHVTVGTNSNMPNALIHHRPKDELQAKFSMEFCMAILLLDGKANLGEFNDATVNRPDVKAMIEKIDFGVNDEAERAGFDKMTTIIDVELKDGKKLHTRADFGKGSPANPMTYDEVADKFRGCCDFARVAKATQNEIVAMVRDLETLPSISKLTALLLKAG
jgi:2-methylcitrate dehydratase PrpD